MMAMGQHIQPALRHENLKVTADWEARSITAVRPRVLVVDDDLAVRQTLTMLLTAAGYETSAAQNGFDALQRIKREAPTLLLCDLDMPEMSGFELLTIVRRRFPGIAVVAMSGSYLGDAVPEGVMADAFYGKGQKRPPELFRIVADVIQKAPARARSHREEQAVIWGHRIGTDTAGKPLVLVTCPDCLRSFAVALGAVEANVVHEARCVFCRSEMQYIAEESPVRQNFRVLASIVLCGRGGASETKELSAGRCDSVPSEIQPLEYEPRR